MKKEITQKSASLNDPVFAVASQIGDTMEARKASENGSDDKKSESKSYHGAVKLLF
jgi:hypothetical protein